MTTPGWIKLYRKITECEIWKDDDPFSKRDAWIDILLQCNYEEKIAVVGLKPITIKAGSFMTSQDRLAVRWHWGRQKVRMYLHLLEGLNMITTKTSTKYTIITVPNFEGYQGLKNDEFLEPTKNQQSNQQRTNRATNKKTNSFDEENPIDIDNFEGEASVEEPSKKPTECSKMNQQELSKGTTTKEYKNIRNKEYIIPPPHNTKYISNSGAGGGEFNLFLAVENALKLPMTRDLADKFIALLDEVGEGVLKEALDESVKYNGRSYAYVETVARRIASGDRGEPKNAGAIDWDEVKRMVEKEAKNADNKQ